jgi:DNA-binding NarL/FixJ family response regulator
MSSILLIQSDPMAGRLLQDALDGDPRYTVCGNVTRLTEASRILARRTPHLLISDIRLVDGSLCALLRDLRRGCPHALVMTASLHDPHLMHALRSGADGFLLAGGSTDAMLQVIRETLAGGSPIAPEIARQVRALFDVLDSRPIPLGGLPAPALHPAERQLLEWASEGNQPHEIAHRMSITTAEVGRRVRALYRSIRFERLTARAFPHAA